MSDELTRLDRSPTDEPDGTPAMAASLREPGDSIRQSADDEPGGDDSFAEPADPAGAPPLSRAGYDVEVVSGGTEEYRPES